MRALLPSGRPQAGRVECAPGAGAGAESHPHPQLPALAPHLPAALPPKHPSSWPKAPAPSASRQGAYPRKAQGSALAPWPLVSSHGALQGWGPSVAAEPTLAPEGHLGGYKGTAPWARTCGDSTARGSARLSWRWWERREGSDPPVSGPLSGPRGETGGGMAGEEEDGEARAPVAQSHLWAQGSRERGCSVGPRAFLSLQLAVLSLRSSSRPWGLRSLLAAGGQRPRTTPWPPSVCPDCPPRPATALEPSSIHKAESRELPSVSGSVWLSPSTSPSRSLSLSVSPSTSTAVCPGQEEQGHRGRWCDTTQQSGISHRSFRRNSTPPVATGKGVKASESGGCPGGRSPVLRCTGKLTRPAEVPKPALKAHQGPCRLPLLPKSASPGAAAQLAMAGNVSGGRFCPATR